MACALRACHSHKIVQAKLNRCRKGPYWRLNRQFYQEITQTNSLCVEWQKRLRAKLVLSICYNYFSFFFLFSRSKYNFWLFLVGNARC